MVEAIRSVPGHDIVRVSGRDPEKLARWQSQFGVANASTDMEATVSAGDVDAVYIALPPAWHARWTIAALEAGKRVLCEKPVSVKPEAVQAMVAVSRSTGVPLTHATGFLHHPRSLAMREVVRSGELGDVRRVTVACSFSGIVERPGDHRSDAAAGGGCLLDLGWYCVYSTLWLTGQPVESIRDLGAIQAIGTRLEPSNGSSAWIQVQAMARLSGGAIASWDCGYDAAGRKWLEVAGTRGSVICDDFLRPWDVQKPRYWVHGHDGKARSVSLGEGLLQETAMVAFAADCTLQESLEQMELAVETQRILKRIELAALASASVPTELKPNR
jgi:dTDP-3,4-didehydro-2,6-dideoxy-alpha-D-glucose 3-reductase